MNKQNLTQSGPLPRFADDLGGFVTSLRTRLFSTQSKAAHYFGLKSHGTISRYESEMLRPPLGYVANLVRLYAEKLAQEGEPDEASQAHFLRELNRLIRQRYNWDEVPFHSWEELCAVADEFMAERRGTGSKSGLLETPMPPSQAADPISINEPPSIKLKDFLGEVIGPQTLTFLFGDPDKQRSLRNRQMMLNLVKDFWIKGVLENSLYDSALIELGMAQRQNAVERPWDVMVKMLKQPDHLLPPGVKMVDLFNGVGQALLILGEPGSGKTTMLLDLARDLVAQAEQNPLQPIPVVFNLASWTTYGQPIAEWLVEELQAKYRIPRKIARVWVGHDELLPLLDGLDEVVPDRREACVRAINHFREEHLVPLVVCSRVADYEALTTRLKLRGAVLLLPLTPEQIEDYLDRLGPELRELRQIVQDDLLLRELAQTPLMLNIMMLAYQQIPSDQFDQTDTVEAGQKHLFEIYVARMLERKGYEHKSYSDEQTRYWLTWLARQMSRHNQTIYLIEQMQPGWLSDRKWQWRYLLLSRMGSMVSGGLLIGLVAGISGAPLLRLSEALLTRPGGWLMFGLTLGIINWLILVMIDGVRFKREENIAAKKLPSLRQSGFNIPVIGLLFGLVDGLIFWAFGGPILGLIGGLTLGLTYGLAVEMRNRRRQLLDEIRPVEALSWSGKKALRGAAAGLAVGGALGSITGWAVGLDAALAQEWAGGPMMRLVGENHFVLMGSLFGACVLGLIGAIFDGVNGKIVETKRAPTQGIWLSFKYALFSWLGIGLIIGVSGGILFGLLSGLQHSIRVGLALFICFGSLAALWYGGLDLIQHYTLRLLLWRRGDMPAQYVRFLDYAAEHIFLRKAGGGYVFIHRLLQDYFASLGPD